MPLPRWVARANRVGLNKVVRRIAPRAPGFGLLVHRGRKSGKEFRTPVNVFRTGDGVRIALTYGSRSDWVRNVLAAGGCSIVMRGRTEDFTEPVLRTDPARGGMPLPVRTILRLTRVDEFLDLHRPA
ncbi:nitroreductase family deazaflavin-dependent oxidoreductase [Nakamurella sp. YIM 132087]|uniref:Nitroreductase family deazaflavin-dependent oxidoreductase n=1 Tax=Nakamurella alba TaxID=2665158 RepID=A0A7K1FI71_9ACTN|nr:nitroreductase family deazaflavin-dependent oxidoreductase [Nakamurella alba]MTD13827.1 nitroreductase family deazaflavin-dependent oxidoreductase [Nakamurella alba]